MGTHFENGTAKTANASAAGATGADATGLGAPDDTTGADAAPTIIDHIGELVTNCADPNDAAAPATAIGDLAAIHDAAVVVRSGRIAWAGPRDGVKAAIDGLDAGHDGAPRVIDLGGRALIPGFVDSHSHLVFGGDRGDEFEARMSGQPYDGGGIMRTVRATRAAGTAWLADRTARLVAEARAQGTTTMEIKTGYGLDAATEARLARVAALFTPEVTFLGGHAVPSEYRGGDGTDDGATLGGRDDYVRLVCGPMLDAVAATGAAKWVDVFCEPHSPYAFDGDETRAMIAAGVKAGLTPRLHGAQLGEGPGPAIAVEFDAASVDHCTFLTDDDLDALAASWNPGATAAATGEPAHGTVATFLPAVEFSTRQPYPDMRRAIDAGARVAIATDCNPGTCFSDSIPFAIAIAVREMGLTPAEAVWAATAGGALALRRDDIGVVRVGARADLAVIDAPSHAHIAYRAGVPLTHALEL